MISTFKKLAILLLLPTACSTDQDKYYTEGDFAKVDKIDTHIHIHAARTDFIEQAIKDNFRVVTIALDPYNSLDSVKKQHHFSVLQEKMNPGPIEFATAFSMQGWDDPHWVEKSMAWLDSGLDDGAKAVKVWKNIGMVFRDKDGKLIMIDNPRFDPIFKMLADRKITVIGHLGEPKNCWLPLDKMTTRNDSSYFSQHPQYHMFKHPDYPSYEEQIAARDRMLERNPELTFVGAHLGSLEWDTDELAKRLDKFPNMAVDMAARMGQLFSQTHFNREKVRAFFVKYQDRLVYATDMADDGVVPKDKLVKEMHDTWFRDWRYFVTDQIMTSDLLHENFQGLKLPKTVVDKIYYQNAKKWFNAF